MEIYEQPFVFREVFKNGHLTISSFRDRVYSFSDSVVEAINVFLSAYKEPGGSGNNKSGNSDDDAETQLLVISISLCVFVIILSQQCLYGSVLISLTPTALSA
jgi:hypothetical protein